MRSQRRSESVVARKRNIGSAGSSGSGELISIEMRQREREESVLRGLCARLAQGDQTAVAELYDQTVARIYGLALHICGDAANAEAAVEETYLQAWRNVRNIERNMYERGVLGWLLRIARDCALQLRNPSPAPAADLLAITRQNSAIHHALSTLTPLQRSAVGEAVLRNHQGEDLAEALDTGKGAATGALNAGLKRLAGG